MIHKTLPTAPEKIALKILMQSSASEAAIPAVRPQSQSLPIPKVPQTITQVKNSPLVPSKPAIAVPQQSVPALSVPTAPYKASEAIPVAVPKVSPPPIAKENYEEENLGRIRSILMERLTYPKNAMRLKQQGEATVTFTLETTREVSQISITKSSGFELLDNAAKNLIESSASEFPKPSKTVRISVPVAYKLR